MIYYCIPCHNEERTVGIVLWKIRQVMADLPRDYQILVADDGSRDGSSAILEPYARVLPLTLLASENRRGYAATLEMLLREADRRSAYPKRDAVVVLQADFTDDPEFAGALLRKLESGADIAIGSPVAGARHKLARRLAQRLALRRTWPAEIRDPLHGFNAIRLICLRKALEERAGRRLLTHGGGAANAELLQATLPHARRIEVVDIVTHPERLQRGSRVAPFLMLREAWRFAGGRDGRPERTVEQLAPDRVHADRSTLRTEAAAPAGDDEEAARPARRSEPGGRTGRRRPADRSEGAERPRRRKTSARRGPSRGETEPSPDGDTSQPDRPVDESAGQEIAPKPSKRRTGRRGSRRRKDRPAADAVEQERPAETAVDAPEAGRTGTDASSVDGEASKPRRPRRRRGRRGGRRRRSGGSASGTVDAEGSPHETPPEGGAARDPAE